MPSKNMLPIPLEGIKDKEGCGVRITVGMEDVRDFLDKMNGYYESEEFFPLEVGQAVRFTVRYRGNSLTLIGNIDLINSPVAGAETMDGWVNISGVWFSPEELALFNTANEIASNGGKHYNLMLTGGSGYGKTARAKAWAEHSGKAYARLNVALLQDELSAFGTGVLDGDKTRFVLSEATEIMQEGNAVILLDEANRAQPNFLNGYYPILDDERGVMLTTPEGNIEIRVGDNVLFIATVNLGHQFTGTFEMDSAFRKRFGASVEVTAPPLDVEVKLLQDRYDVDRNTADTIVLAMHKLRNMDKYSDSDLDVTTRKALQIAQLVKAGMPMRMAFKVALVNIDPNLFKGNVDIINELLG